jgi:hypothetical protein
VKSIDQILHVSNKTVAALLAAEHKLNDTCSDVKMDMSFLIYDFVEEKNNMFKYMA